MAYNKEEIIQQAIKEINDRKLTTIEEVVAFLPISMSTFYGWKLEELEDIKEPLYRMRTIAKKALKNKWYSSGNFASEIAWFKLHATPEELSALSMNKVEHSGQIDSTVTHVFQEIEVKPDDSDSE